MLTLDDRARAIEVVTQALRTRTELVLAVVRDEPTAILSGEVIPGALFGIEDSAAGMVDAMLDAFRLSAPGQRRKVRAVEPKQPQ